VNFLIIDCVSVSHLWGLVLAMLAKLYGLGSLAGHGVASLVHSHISMGTCSVFIVSC
jgi:hypothetical protein